MSDSFRQRLLTLGFTLSVSLGFDQTTKRIVEHTFGDEPSSYFFDTIRFQFIKNSGAFLGLGSNYNPTLKLWLFFILPSIFLLGALIYCIVEEKLDFLSRSMIALMVSGGLGNLIDRIFFSGQVTDFINMGIGPVRTGIFNIADVAIMAGAFGLLLVHYKNSPQKNTKTQERNNISAAG